MGLELSERVAVVVGGSSGIGRATATRLAAEGCHLVLVGRSPERLEAAATELQANAAGKVSTAQADTTVLAEVQQMGERVLSEFGRVDILVNCAARPAGQIPKTTWETLDESIVMPELDTKFLGYLRCSQVLVPHMVANGWGRVINVAGMATLRTGDLIATVRNVAVVALTKNLADALAHTGVNVNGVHPDLTRTERTPGMMQRRAAAAGVTPEEIEASIGKQNLVGRLIDAADVAEVIAFLASPRSVAINGEMIAVNGGRPGPIRY